LEAAEEVSMAWAQEFLYIYIYIYREREREGERELRTTLLPCPMITALLLVAKKLLVGDMLAAAASKGWLHLLL
jgi:hypothetical protein